MSGYGLLEASGAYKANLLDLRQKRQEIIASNIANADTPGYKARRLEFEDALKSAMPTASGLSMAHTHKNHLPLPLDQVEGEIQEVETSIPKGDGNSVDMEQEMVRQSANQLLYNYAAESLSGQISTMRMIIEGGNK
ncbi:MAG: flagellar basal body rod protein FlgB [Magnetococcus sp. DMHC-6]